MKGKINVVDNYDKKLVEHLLKQARSTWAELGTLLGLSAPAAAERVHKLEDRGVIKGYSALVNPESVGLGLAALISVHLERPEHKANFLEMIFNLPEIQECHHVAGEEDYVIKVICKGTRDLERLISEQIKSVKGVIKTKTTIILSTVKDTPILPIPYENE